MCDDNNDEQNDKRLNVSVKGVTATSTPTATEAAPATTTSA